MNLIFSEERFIDAWPEFKVLAEMHWQETELYRHGQTFLPDEKRYAEFNESGFYRLFTVRDVDADNRLVGDCGMYVTVSMHTQIPCAMEDTWFLLPSYRKGRNAIKFFKYIEERLKLLGVREIICSTKITNRAGSLLEYMGYQHIANQYHKAV